MNWDLELLMLDGALGGTLVGSLFELGEAYFDLPGGVEPPMHFMAEIAAVSVAGAVLCALVATCLKRLKPGS
ncbi:hypothetical protein [Microvirga sp. M2]|uniref:hypothetical protein n=1 Tax=Microvirga sp. M2 TaxID=3073270 RepID=UPI0039C12812